MAMTSASPGAAGGDAPRGYVLGIDLGGTNLRLVVAGPDGAFIARASEAIDPAAGPRPILARVISTGRQILKPYTDVPLLSVGLASPGVVDVHAGTVVAARNLHGWNNVPVRQSLEEGFGVPATVDNDVNLAALGEQWRGAGRGHEDMVFISVGTGVGSGIVIGGRVHRGRHFAAGEINSLPSGCPAEDGAGEAGLEDVASGPAIVRRALARGVRPATERLTTADVFAAARHRDEAAAQVIRDAIGALARGVAALVAAIDPGVVVIGGGVSRQGDALLVPLEEQVKTLVRLRARLVRSELGVDAQLHGAAAMALAVGGPHPPNPLSRGGAPAGRGLGVGA